MVMVLSQEISPVTAVAVPAQPLPLPHGSASKSAVVTVTVAAMDGNRNRNDAAAATITSRDDDDDETSCRQKDCTLQSPIITGMNQHPHHHASKKRRCIAHFWQALALLLLHKQLLQHVGTAAAAAAASAVLSTTTTNGADSAPQKQQQQQQPPTQQPTPTLLLHNSQTHHSKTATATTKTLEEANEIEETESSKLFVVDDSSDSDEEEDAFIIFAETVQDQDPDDADDSDTTAAAEEEEDEGVIVVSMVDGTLAGLSRATGHTLWKRAPNPQHSSSSSSYRMRTATESASNNYYNKDYDAAAAAADESKAPTPLLEPLVSTTTTVGSGSNAHRWRTAAVPSILDGKVYLTAASSSAATATAATASHGECDKNDNSNGDSSCGCGGENEEQEETTVTTFIRDLVDRAPFVDSRGRMYTGHRRSVAVAVDAATGEIVQTIASDAKTPRQQPKSSSSSSSSDNHNVLWMGRIDYTVSIHEPRTGELDVQFTTAELISVHDMLLGSGGGGGDGSSPWNNNNGIQYLLSQSRNKEDGSSVAGDFVSRTSSSSSNRGGSHRLRQQQTQKLQHVIATPSGNVAFRDPETGEIVWVAEETFATPVAFALDSTTGASLGVEFVPDAVVPHGSMEYVSGEMQRQLQLRSSSISLHIGDDMLKSDGKSSEDETIVGSLPASGQLFAIPLGKQRHRSSEIQAHSASKASSAATAIEQPKHQHGSPTITAGRHHQHAQFYHDSHHHSHAGGAQPQHACSPGSPHFPRCLITGTHDRRDSLSSRKHHHPNFLSDAAGSPFEVGVDGAIVPFYHPDYGYQYVPPDQFYTINGDFHKNRKRYQKILRFLGSWLPPLVALIFVSSFELGRRKRQKHELDSRHSIVPANGEHAKGAVGAGIIQVYEDVILGHGGHGTIVYKGMLEGRQVAVKRMLKTYNASADREISLLIESDGHPNVVRYFLKEIRGDFVYLALELCDLSLHDLIGHIRSRLDRIVTEDEKKKIFAASKSILYQIAKGGEHLHKLRIVHRDMKPANILLADSRQYKAKQKKNAESESVCEIFERGDYVAKISDMGLGKQLVGQSSYGGGSLLDDSSLRGQSNGVQSSIIGVGPGSVGWQAPEVMALRMPSDVSIKSDGSSPNDPASEMSPIDVSPNARTSRSVDIFSLGCIFYSTLVPGSHPFGEWYEREANIMHNKPNIEAIQSLSLEAYDLVDAMLKRSPSVRPTAKQICEHPFFWSPDRRLSLLCDFSDRLETDSVNTSAGDSLAFLTKVLAVERNASQVVGTSWDRVLHPDLISNVQRFRTYDPSSIRDLLRLIRNKHHHFDELPSPLKESIGSKTEGLIEYFEARFPRLLIHCFNVCRELYPSDDVLSIKYSITPIGRPTNRLMGSEATIVETSECEAMDKDSTRTSLTDEMPVDNTASTVRTDGYEASVDEEMSNVPQLATEPLISPIPKVSPVEEHLFPQGALELAGPCIGNDKTHATDTGDLVIWQGSTAAKTFQCRGWNRSDDEWQHRGDIISRRRDSDLVRCADDPKFRTRLCNHWDTSLGTFCPMRKKSKCIFAHGPVELRVKEAKRNRWGKLVDKNGDNNNPNHSGGEDTYWAARAIECERKQEGKWNTNKPTNHKGKTVQSTKKKQQPAPVIA